MAIKNFCVYFDYLLRIPRWANLGLFDLYELLGMAIMERSHRTQ